MELFKLDDSYLPGNTVKTFETLVWTERYQTAGDFQLIIENYVAVLNELPLGSLISHTDTKEVMIVENHEIQRDKKKTLKITISGRSFETFAENRPTAGSSSAMVDGGGVTIVETIASATSASVASQILKGQLEPGTASATNAIPNLIISTDIVVPDTAMAQVVKRGDVYSRVLEYLRLCNAGIKMVRPNGAQTTLNLVIHDGIDRQNSVIFYAQYEDLDDAKYFMSIKNYKNYAQIATHTTNRLYRDRNVGADVDGLERRVMYVEADDLVGAFSPPAADDYVSSRAQANLDERQMVSLIQAQISKSARPKFKIHYDIGDLVTVFGEFGTNQSFRVTEHILTVDKNGMQGYPSLSGA